ncbi:MAG: hypothetical protein PHU01_11625, partial [Desulfuromonadaceae bacterium]|nr:hypothetical protein [Desulfuromonadaceae bacterium]
SGNKIRKNETGIFVREKRGGLLIRGNNTYDNNNYAVRVGDFNNEDVNARGNWWGGADTSEVIFDANDEPGIGNVLVEPLLSEPAGAVSGDIK